MKITLKASVKLGLALICFMLLGVYATTIREVVFKFPWGTPSKADKIKLLPGFKAEHLYSPSEAGNGSWVSMTFDDKGRMIASDQYGYLYRLTIPPVGSDTNTTKIAIEKLEIRAADDT